VVCLVKKFPDFQGVDHAHTLHSYSVYMDPPLVRVVSQMNSTHIVEPNFLILSFILCLGLPKHQATLDFKPNSLYSYVYNRVHVGAQLVEALCYKSESRVFDSRWCHLNFSLTKFFPGVDSASKRKE
jgi:hypothetical protein